MNLLKKLAFTVATAGVICDCSAIDMAFVLPQESVDDCSAREMMVLATDNTKPQTIGYETFAKQLEKEKLSQSGTPNRIACTDIESNIVNLLGTMVRRSCLLFKVNQDDQIAAREKSFKRECIDTAAEDDAQEWILLGAFCNTLSADIVRLCEDILTNLTNISSMNPVMKYRPVQVQIAEHRPVFNPAYARFPFDFYSFIYFLGGSCRSLAPGETNMVNWSPFVCDITVFSARYCLAKGFADWVSCVGTDIDERTLQIRRLRINQLRRIMRGLSIKLETNEVNLPEDIAYANMRKLFGETTEAENDHDTTSEAAVISSSDFPNTRLVLSTSCKEDNVKFMQFLRQVFEAF